MSALLLKRRKQRFVVPSLHRQSGYNSVIYNGLYILKQLECSYLPSNIKMAHYAQKTRSRFFNATRRSSKLTWYNATWADCFPIRYRGLRSIKSQKGWVVTQYAFFLKCYNEVYVMQLVCSTGRKQCTQLQPHLNVLHSANSMHPNSSEARERRETSFHWG